MSDQGTTDQEITGQNGSNGGDGGNGSRESSRMELAETTRAEPVFIPPTDIIETTDNVLLLMDMPGADPDSLDVTLDRRVLNISARSSTSAPEGYTPLHVEFRDGSYERSLSVTIRFGEAPCFFKRRMSSRLAAFVLRRVWTISSRT